MPPPAVLHVIPRTISARMWPLLKRRVCHALRPAGRKKHVRLQTTSMALLSASIHSYVFRQRRAYTGKTEDTGKEQSLPNLADMNFSSEPATTRGPRHTHALPSICLLYRSDVLFAASRLARGSLRLCGLGVARGWCYGPRKSGFGIHHTGCQSSTTPRSRR